MQRGAARRGVAWRGVAWHGVAWRGMAFRGIGTRVSELPHGMGQCALELQHAPCPEEPEMWWGQCLVPSSIHVIISINFGNVGSDTSPDPIPNGNS